MKAITETKIRNNHVVRFIGLPFKRISRYIQYIDYHHRVNTDYFRSVKGSRKGDRCFIIGNGPSLTASDLDLIKSETSFAVNRFFYMYEYTVMRPTYYMVTDTSIINEFVHRPVIDTEAEKTFVCTRKLAEYWGHDMDIQEIIMVGNVPIAKEKFYMKNISEDVSDHFSVTQSVTISAFELAFYMGFSEIYLLGVDHDFAYEIDMSGKKKISKDKASHFKEDKDKSIYFAHKEALTKCFEVCKKYADSHGVKVYNCTRGGKLEVFERKNLEDVINGK